MLHAPLIGGDDRHLDVEQVVVQLAADPPGLVEQLGAGILVGGELAGRVGGAEAVHERGAGAGEDDHAEVAVAGDVGEGVGEGLVRAVVEDELVAVGVELHEEDVLVALLEPDVPLVAVAVVLEPGPPRHGVAQTGKVGGSPVRSM